VGKLRVLSGVEVCEILAGHGFVEVRRRSSHIVMQRKEANSTTTVPVPDHDEVKSARSGPLFANQEFRGVNLSRNDKAMNDANS